VHPAILAFLRSRVEASHSIVDKHLMDRPFMLGDRPTIVDFFHGGVRVLSCRGDRLRYRGDFPAIHAWRQRLAALAGLEAAFKNSCRWIVSPVRLTQQPRSVENQNSPWRLGDSSFDGVDSF